MSNFSNSFKHLLGILIVMVGPPQVSLQDQVLDESDHVLVPLLIPTERKTGACKCCNCVVI
jgi:hypothetical protein